MTFKQIMLEARQITRPANCVEAERLWARYAALLRAAEPTKKQEDELFLLRQQLSIPNRHHEIYAAAIAAEAPLADAEEKYRQASRAMAEAYEESRQITAEHKAAIQKMHDRVQAADEKRMLAECAYSTALENCRRLSGLRARFWRLFGGTEPGSDETCLPPELFNAISSLGFDPRKLKRDLPACQ